MSSGQYRVLAAYPIGPTSEVVVLSLPKRRTLKVTRAVGNYFTFNSPSVVTPNAHEHLFRTPAVASDGTDA